MMDAKKISADPFEATDDDRALNEIQDALEAGKVVLYRGSVEDAYGARVLWMERCEYHHPRDGWRDCCFRRQARIGVRRGETQEAELRHVAAFHLDVVTTMEEVASQHAPRNWFLRGVFASCSCGYEPADNRALNVHWAELGTAWYDDHGTLRVRPA